MSEHVSAAATWLCEAADLVPDACTPRVAAMVTIGGMDDPVGPGSTIGAVAIVNAIKVRTAELVVERAAMPLVMTRVSAGPEGSRARFGEACTEHARRGARAIDQSRGG